MFVLAKIAQENVLNKFKPYRILKNNALLPANLERENFENENKNRNVFSKFRKDMLKHTEDCLKCS